MLKRIWTRLEEKIPKSQAAYQGGRGTAEQILSIKIIIEKAITSSDIYLYLDLLDMSKAFDTVNRKLLFEELENILKPDEMHILAILTNRPKITIKLENSYSEDFETYQGICQGDCLSAILFIFYLARALKDERIPDTNIYIDPKYADDITYLTDDKNHSIETKKEIPIRLRSYALSANEEKTESYTIGIPPPPPTPPPPKEKPTNQICWSELDWLIPPKFKPEQPTEWKECKLLGSKLDTSCDIKNRKSKTWQPMKKFDKFFKSTRISTSTKIRIYKQYVEPIFLYNCELWTLSSKLEKQINSFQRRQMRVAINNRYPKTIKSEILYEMTNTEELSKTIKRRRLNFFGHVLRLHEETPAQKALEEVFKPYQRPVGRPPITWISQILKDLNETRKHHNISNKLVNKTLKSLKELAKNRQTWQQEVARSMGV